MVNITGKIYSAVLYIVVFFCTICSFWVGEQLGPRGERGAFCKKALFLVGILLPCLLAGLRADSVGRDVTVYIIPNIAAARAAHGGFLGVCKTLNMAPEYLYMILVYIATRITDDAGLLLFLIQLLTFLPIVMAANQLKKEVSISLAVASYLFCFYLATLNIMRQSIACSFILLGTAYLFCNNMKLNFKTILSYLCAIFFHKTGIFGVITVYALCRLSTARIRRKVYYLIYGAIILIPVVLPALFTYLNSKGLIGQTYVWYGNIFLYRIGVPPQWILKSPFSFWATAIVLLLIWRTGIPCFFIYINRIHNPRVASVRAISICGLLIYLVIHYAYSTIYGERIALPFAFFVILLVPYAAQGKFRLQKKAVLLLAIFVFWLCNTYILGFDSAAGIYKFRI